MTKVKGGPQFQLRPCRSFENAILHVNGILEMWKKDALLQDQIADMVSPNRETVFEAKFTQEICAVQIELATGAFFTAERNDIFAAEAQEFGDMTPHHDAPERGGQGGNEQAVIAPGDCSGDGTGSVTA